MTRNSGIVALFLFMLGCELDIGRLSADATIAKQTGFKPTNTYLNDFEPGAMVWIDEDNSTVHIACKADEAIGAAAATYTKSPFPDTAILSTEKVSVTMREAFAAVKDEIRSKAEYSSVLDIGLLLVNAETHSLSGGTIQDGYNTMHNEKCNAGLKLASTQRDSQGNIPQVYFLDVALIGDIIYTVLFKESASAEVQAKVLLSLSGVLGGSVMTGSAKIQVGKALHWGVSTVNAFSN